MKISCGIVPSLDSVEQATLAEELGYDRAWLYDSPALYADIWVTMARIAEHTDRIGLGTAEFFGIQDKATRVVYVLDCSGSMLNYGAIRVAKDKGRIEDLAPTWDRGALSGGAGIGHTENPLGR